MSKYVNTQGKAFSYFSIVAKNYLIFHNTKNWKDGKINVPVGDQDEENTTQLQKTDKHHDEKEIKEFLVLMIKFWDENLNRIFKKQKDLCIAQAVVELFRNSDRIDYFNKKALYLYIREISSCKTSCITKVINKMKSYQKHIRKSYLNSGNI